MGVVLAREGLVRLVNLSTMRPIAEPNARLRFINRKTRQPMTIYLNSKGNFPRRTMVTADTGDILDIYGFCGRWIKVGQIDIPPPMPTGLPKIAPFRGIEVAFRVAPDQGARFCWSTPCMRRGARRTQQLPSCGCGRCGGSLPARGLDAQGPWTLL